MRGLNNGIPNDVSLCEAYNGISEIFTRENFKFVVCALLGKRFQIREGGESKSTEIRKNWRYGRHDRAEHTLRAAQSTSALLC